MSAWPARPTAIEPVDFALVDCAVGAEPGAHQGLQPQLVGDARRLLMAVGAREAADPACVRPDDLEPRTDLRCAHDRPRRLALEIRAEAQAVHAGRERVAKLVVQHGALLRRQRRRRNGTGNALVACHRRLGRCGRCGTVTLGRGTGLAFGHGWTPGFHAPRAPSPFRRGTATVAATAPPLRRRRTGSSWPRRAARSADICFTVSSSIS